VKEEEEMFELHDMWIHCMQVTSIGISELGTILLIPRNRNVSEGRGEETMADIELT
jgi:hypothetical protein